MKNSDSGLSSAIHQCLSLRERPLRKLPKNGSWPLLRQEPALTCKALAAGTGITADGIKYHLTKLTESGRIRRVGPTRKGHWEVLAKEEEK